MNRDAAAANEGESTAAAGASGAAAAGAPAAPVPSSSAELAAPLWPERYDMLDGWRGVAALAVVVTHLGSAWLGQPAVMIFFVISGYCITAAASACLRNGLSFRQFMWRRIRRIYPPYFFSLLYFVATRAAKQATGGGNQLNYPPIVWIQNLTLTQWVTNLWHPLTFAGDNRVVFVAAYWSLNYEEQFYLVTGLMLVLAPLLRIGMRWFVVGLMAVALAWNWYFGNVVYGFFIEYWAHFAIGSLVFYRLCRVTSAGGRRAVDLAFAGLFVACAIAAWRTGWHLHRVERNVWFELAVVSGFALVLVALRPLSGAYKASFAGRWLTRLGLISYSLYLIHQCNLAAVHAIVSRVVPARFSVAAGVVEVACHVAIAVVFWYLCERPFLNKPVGGKRGTAAGTSGFAAGPVKA